MAVVGIFLCCSCSFRNILRDDKSGKVTRVYRAVHISRDTQENRALGELIIFVRVEPTGELVFKTNISGRVSENRAMPFTQIQLQGIASIPMEPRVLTTSFEGQWAEIEYRAWSSELQQ